MHNNFCPRITLQSATPFAVWNKALEQNVSVLVLVLQYLQWSDTSPADSPTESLSESLPFTTYFPLRYIWTLMNIYKMLWLKPAHEKCNRSWKSHTYWCLLFFKKEAMLQSMFMENINNKNRVRTLKVAQEIVAGTTNWRWKQLSNLMKKAVQWHEIQWASSANNPEYWNICRMKYLYLRMMKSFLQVIKDEVHFLNYMKNFKAAGSDNLH